MLLRDLISGLTLRAPQGSDLSVRICDLTEDSRTVLPGSLFVARSGRVADGRKFVGDACAAGAAAIVTDDPDLACDRVPVLHASDIMGVSGALAERFYGCPTSALRLVGVTGTNGKTTISFLVWQMLNARARRCGLIGTVLVDDGREVGPASMTTPPAVELSRLCASMVEGGCGALAMEVSSHALDQKRADALRFRVGVFTNLTGDHLDYHKTMEAYADAKARLFGLLDQGGRAIVPLTDPWTPRVTATCRAPIWTCAIAGRDTAADCTAEITGSDMDGMTLLLRGPWGEFTTRVALIGNYNAMNVLQATAACHALGLTAGDLEVALRGVTAPPGRLERVSTPADRIFVFVDYAHSDDSLRNVLRTVGAAMPGRGHKGERLATAAGAVGEATQGSRLWAVFGCGGDRDRTKRPRMGLAAAECADELVLTSDNPRTERPGDIIAEVLAGIPGESRGRLTVQVDRERAIRHAIEAASPGDVVVIAGKGHETEQILSDGAGGIVRTHFDDREVAGRWLDQRRLVAGAAHG